MLMHDHMSALGGVVYDDDEMAFAHELKQNFRGRSAIIESAEEVQPWSNEIARMGGSTDVGDVSWVVPTHGVTTATWVPGTPAHSWAAVAAGGMSIGHKGMHLAAEVLALTARELFVDRDKRDAIRAEFVKRRGASYQYQSLLGDRPPPLNYRGVE
jgi:aminobenzoyl-glutamate utilization protein B